MPAGTLAPSPGLRFFDPLTGAPIISGHISTYVSGTVSTPATVYQDANLAVPWGSGANAVALDSAGFAVVYMGSDSQKWVITRADASIVATIDPVSSVQLSAAIVTDIIPLGGSVSEGSTDAAYPAGATLDKILFGTKTFDLNSGDITGTWALRAMLRSDNGASAVTLALVNLTDGAPNTAMVEITTTSAIGVVVTSTAITFPAAGSTKTYAVKVKVAAGFGQAWNVELVRTA